MANEATTFYKRLASCLAINHTPPPCPGCGCRLTSLLRLAIQCIRGARSSMLSSHHPPSTWPSLNFNVSKLLDSLELVSYSVPGPVHTTVTLFLYHFLTPLHVTRQCFPWHGLYIPQKINVIAFQTKIFTCACRMCGA